MASITLRRQDEIFGVWTAHVLFYILVSVLTLSITMNEIFCVFRSAPMTADQF